MFINIRPADGSAASIQAALLKVQRTARAVRASLDAPAPWPLAKDTSQQQLALHALEVRQAELARSLVQAQRQERPAR